MVVVLLGGCGPAVEESTGGEGSSSSGEPSATTAPSATTRGTAPLECEVEHGFGRPMEIEVINERAETVQLEGRGCDPPLILSSSGEPINWAPDCSWDICDPDPNAGCGVCDCGQVTIVLEPGASTRFEWNGSQYALLDREEACGVELEPGCAQCWVGIEAPAAEYEAQVEFRAFCNGAPCPGGGELEAVVSAFSYPTPRAVVVIP